MSGVLALALERMALSHGTVPSAVPVGQRLDSGTNGTGGTLGTSGTVSAAVVDREPIDPDAIKERAALAADRVPACYLDAWARMQCQLFLSIDLDVSQRVVNDAGMFLDAWGADAAAMQWGAGELFDVPREGRAGGLIWQIDGERVDALGDNRARLTDGRTIKRGARE